MMDKFFIGFDNNDGGLQQNVLPWLINEEAWSLLENMYVFRGRMRKRLGSKYMGANAFTSRFRIYMGTTNGSGSSGVVNFPVGSKAAIGQIFSVGTNTYTVYQLGAGVPGLATTGAITINSVATTLGTWSITGATINTAIYFYPSLPAMGLDLFYNETTNTYNSVGFDTKRSYTFDNSLICWLDNSLGDAVGMTDGAGNADLPFKMSSIVVGTYFYVGATTFYVADSTLIAPYNLIPGGAAVGTAILTPNSPVTGISELVITGSELSLPVTSNLSFIWTGSDAQFFWTTAYQGAVASLSTLWETNNNIPDGIRYFDGTTWRWPVLNYSKGIVIGTTSGGVLSGTIPAQYGPFFIGQTFTIGLTTFTVAPSTTVSPYTLIPSTFGASVTGSGTFNILTGDFSFTGAYDLTSIFFSAQMFVNTALMIIQFRNRLLFLNTTENVTTYVGSVATQNPTNYSNRVRWSSIGSPLSPFAFMQEVPGSNFLDAPTTEAIVTANFQRDKLIVYFESSTFELVYNDNQVQPLYWQKLNTELGAESTFSVIPFDKSVLAVDNVGIHSCNGTSVERIDAKIPNLVWGINTDSAVDVNRIQGIREYFSEIALWSYPNEGRNLSFPYPNKLLCFNYVTNSWATYDDSITTFGYYLERSSPPGFTSVNERRVLAGNQQGFVMIMDPELPVLASVLQITNFTIMVIPPFSYAKLNIINHNLSIGDFIILSNMNGLTFTDTNGKILTRVTCQIVVNPLFDPNINDIVGIFVDGNDVNIVITGTYTGGGTAARVSDINMVTKQYNFYNDKDRNVHINRIDFLVDSTAIGQVTVDYYPSFSNVSLVSAGLAGGWLPGNNTLTTAPYNPLLVPLEQYQTQLWHPIYFFADGETIQFRIYFTRQQIQSYVVNQDTTVSFVSEQDMQLHGMVIYANPSASRMT